MSLENPKRSLLVKIGGVSLSGILLIAQCFAQEQPDYKKAGDPSLSEIDKLIFTDVLQFMNDEFGGGVDAVFSKSMTSADDSVEVYAVVVVGYNKDKTPILNRKGFFEMVWKRGKVHLGGIDWPSNRSSHSKRDDEYRVQELPVEIQETYQSIEMLLQKMSDQDFVCYFLIDDLDEAKLLLKKNAFEVIVTLSWGQSRSGTPYYLDEYVRVQYSKGNVRLFNPLKVNLHSSGKAEKQSLIHSSPVDVGSSNENNKLLLKSLKTYLENGFGKEAVFHYHIEHSKSEANSPGTTVHLFPIDEIDENKVPSFRLKDQFSLLFKNGEFQQTK